MKSKWKEPSGVTLRIGEYKLLMSAILLTAITQAGIMMVPLLAVMLVVETTSVDWRQDKNQLAARVAAVTLAFLGYHIVLPPLILLILLTDQKRLRFGEQFVDFFTDKVEDLWDSLVVPVTNPLIGVNHQVVPQFLKDKWDEKMTELRDLASFGLSTQVEYLREVDVSESPVDMGQRPTMEARESVNKFNEIGGTTRIAIFGMIGVFVVAITGPLGAIVVVVTYLISQLETEGEKVSRIERNKGIIFKPGVYRVSTIVMGVEGDRGIGVSMSGVMHVPYHVTKARPIMYGRTKVLPYYINVDQDLVTYGGPPVVDKLMPGDEVFVNCETDMTRTSYKVGIDYDNLDNIIAWQGVTKPGESGSPVLALRGEGDEKTTVLLGLAGRYVRTGGETVEFTNIKPVEKSESKHIQITLHPGAGKTWREIPNLVNRELATGKRILVTGPTRVVCRELYESLSRLSSVGLNIKGSDRVNEHAQVQIAAHRTALRLLTSRARCVRNLGTIIIDEAHFDDTATILLRRFGQAELARGTKLIELSATLDGITNDESNFDITDREITMSEVEATIKEELEAEKRVLVFVPSVKSRVVKQLLNTFKGQNPVILCRESYEAGMKGVQDPSRKLVVSTDIAECGINVRDLEVVVDLGKKFTYTFEGGMVVGMEVGLTAANRTQRRGRVGRDRPGTYYEVKTDRTSKYISAAKFDADLLSVGRGWATANAEWRMSLTDQQFEKWLDSDTTPLDIWMTTDLQGQPRTKESKRKKFQEMKDGTNYYVGCRDEGCKVCEGTYNMFDERMHDKLFKVG